MSKDNTFYSRKNSGCHTLQLIVIMLMMFIGMQSSDAQNISSFNGTYTGTASKILMNGSEKTPQRMTFVLKNGVLIANVPKIGRMPGRIYINIAPVRLHSNSALTTTSKNAGKIKMFGLFSSDLVWDGTSGDRQGAFHGTLSNVHGIPTLNVTLHVYASMMGKKVKATIVFKGIRH